MTERKRPRRTRERILETALALFNRHGAPRVTTAEIAGEMNISPGNLYYHFRSKDEIVRELYASYEGRLAPLFADPAGRAVGVEDLWLWLHVLLERMGEYRFFQRDLPELAAQDAVLAARLGRLLRHGMSTMAELARGMVRAGAMRASEREIGALAQNVMLVAAYWQSFDRIARPPAAGVGEADAGRAAWQVLALIAPYLVGDARELIDRLGRDYL
jgi:AcrR family transcriptional regulator